MTASRGKELCSRPLAIGSRGRSMRRLTGECGGLRERGSRVGRERRESGFMLLPCILRADIGRPLRAAVIVVSTVCGALTFGCPDGAQADAARASIFLGPIADHFLDTTGALTIADVAAEANGAKFTIADGRVANYGYRAG